MAGKINTLAELNLAKEKLSEYEIENKKILEKLEENNLWLDEVEKELKISSYNAEKAEATNVLLETNLKELAERVTNNNKTIIELKKNNKELSIQLKEINNLKKSLKLSEEQLITLTKKYNSEKELYKNEKLKTEPIIHKAKIYDLIVQKTQYQNALLQIDEAIHSEEILINKLLKGD